MSRVWYFAYGSNMQSATLRGRRGIAYRRALPARVSGWRVVFDKPPLVPIGEGFANLLQDPEAAALGVLFELEPADLDHLELTEGVPIGNYARVTVTAVPLDTAPNPLTAVTFSSDRRDPRLLPSTRYMALLVEGAEEHGLPAEYVEFLRAVPARPETAAARAWAPLVEQVLRRG